MATLGEIAVNVVARTQGVESGMRRAGFAVQSFGAKATQVARVMAGLVGIGGGFAGLGFAAKLAADAESSSVAMNNMIGSLTETKALLAEINKFSTVTPFEPTELRNAAQKLLAFNFGASEIMGTLKTLGDVAAGSGSRLDELVNILGKVRDRGKVTAETLSEFGIRSASVMEPLAKIMGVTRGEVVKLASAGKISFNDLVAALQLMTSEGGLFANAMAKQSETLAGKWSTLTGNVKLLAENLGMVLLPAMASIVDVGNRMLGWLLTFDSGAIQMGVSLSLAAVAVLAIGRAIPVVITALQGWSTVLTALLAKQTFLTALSGPAGWAKIGAAIVATGVVAVGFTQILGGVEDKTKDVAAAMKSVESATESAARSYVKFTNLRDKGPPSIAVQLAEAERRAAAAGFAPGAPGVTISSRALGGGGETRSVVDEVQRSNELLASIDNNTRGGIEVNEVSL